MKCLGPLSLPPPQTGGERNIVPCGKCESCLVLKRNQWTFRLTEEFHASKSAYFTTLTYAPGNEPWTSSDRDTLSKADITTFMKKLRRHASQHKEDEKWPPIRFFAAGEYGLLDRPHYHVILFNVPLKTIDNLENIWNNGFVQVATLNYARIHYTTKYVIQPQNDEQENDRQKPFSQMSLRPGIGFQYLQRAGKWHTDNKYPYVINQTGAKQPLPDYYKKKLFTKHERLQFKNQAIQRTIEKDREIVKLENWFEIEQIKLADYRRKIHKTIKQDQL